MKTYANFSYLQKPGVFVKDNEPSVFEEQIKAVFPKDLSKKKNKWHKTGTSKTVDNSTYELPPLKRVQVWKNSTFFFFLKIDFAIVLI